MYLGDAIIINAFISALLVVLIYFLDRAEKEPRLFLCGIYLAAIVGTYVFGYAKFSLREIAGWNDATFSLFFQSFFVAGLAEQGLKLLIFMLLIWKSNNFNEEMDGIVYCMVIAAGFAVVENIYYTTNATSSSYFYGLLTGNFEHYHQSLATILQARYHCGHILFDSIMGFFVGKAKFSPKKSAYFLFFGFIISVILHGFWNYILGAAQDFFYWYLLILSLTAVALIIKMQRETRYKMIHEELIQLLQNLNLSGHSSLSPRIRRGYQKLQKNITYMGYQEKEAQNRLVIAIKGYFSEPETVQLQENEMLTRLEKINKEFRRNRKKTIATAFNLFFTIMIPSALVVAFII